MEKWSRSAPNSDHATPDAQGAAYVATVVEAFSVYSGVLFPDTRSSSSASSTSTRTIAAALPRLASLRVWRITVQMSWESSSLSEWTVASWGTFQLLVVNVIWCGSTRTAPSRQTNSSTVMSPMAAMGASRCTARSAPRLSAESWGSRPGPQRHAAPGDDGEVLHAL